MVDEPISFFEWYSISCAAVPATDMPVIPLVKDVKVTNTLNQVFHATESLVA